MAEAGSLDALATGARRKLRNVITAVRLATGASAYPLVTIDGEPGNVRSMHPHIRPHVRRLIRLAHRPVALGPGDAAGLQVLCSRVDEWLGGDNLENSIDVDRELRTESRRADWLAHIHRYWADAGLASAVAPAPPLQLVFLRATDRSSDDNRSPQGTPNV